MQRAWRVGAVLSLGLLGLFGCGDDDGDGDDDNPPADGGHDAGRMDGGGDAGRDAGPMDGGLDANIDAGPVTETFQSLYNDIFNMKCRSCHSSEDGGVRSGGLSLWPKGDAYMQLVNIHAAGPACGDAGTDGGYTRVIPSKPNESLLVLKVEPSPPCGLRMPRTPLTADASVPPLSTTEIERLRRWIQQGAKND